jgi:hypothetical protein
MAASDFVRTLATTSCLGASLAGALCVQSFCAPPLCAQTVWSQPDTHGGVADSAQSRMRPLGAPSAVDAYSSNGSQVRQVVMMQSPGDSAPVPPPSLPPGGFGFPTSPMPSGPSMPSSSPQGGFALPPSTSLPPPLQSGPVGPIPPVAAPAQPLSPAPVVVSPAPITPQPAPTQSLPFNPNVTGGSGLPPRTTTPAPSPVRNDYMAIPQPQLDTGFATMDNCRNITGPSNYRAASVFGCSPPSYGPPSYGPPIYGAPTYNAPATYVPPPSQIAPAIALPPGTGIAPTGIAGSLPPVIPGSPGYRPLISFGQEANPVQVGQGLLGQPVAYVPGQTIRNALRYLSF